MITTQVEGLQQALADLRAFGGKIEKRAIRRCLTAASKPAKGTIASLAPSRTGALRRSQATKIFSKRGRMVAVTGAKNITYANGQQPWRYSHLVHDGKTNRGGKGRSRANPYLRRGSTSALQQGYRIFTGMMTAEAYAAARKS